MYFLSCHGTVPQVPASHLFQSILLLSCHCIFYCWTFLHLITERCTARESLLLHWMEKGVAYMRVYSMCVYIIRIWLMRVYIICVCLFHFFFFCFCTFASDICVRGCVCIIFLWMHIYEMMSIEECVESQYKWHAHCRHDFQCRFPELGREVLAQSQQ